MDSLLPFPRGCFNPYKMPVYPGAVRVVRQNEAAGATDASLLLSTGDNRDSNPIALDPPQTPASSF